MRPLIVIAAAAALVAGSFSFSHADNSRGERELKNLLSTLIFETNKESVRLFTTGHHEKRRKQAI
jgi:hypothetical protein